MSAKKPKMSKKPEKSHKHQKNVKYDQITGKKRQKYQKKDNNF